MNTILNVIAENIVPIAGVIAFSIFVVKSTYFDGTSNNPHVNAK